MIKCEANDIDAQFNVLFPFFYELITLQSINSDMVKSANYLLTLFNQLSNDLGYIYLYRIQITLTPRVDNLVVNAEMHDPLVLTHWGDQLFQKVHLQQGFSVHYQKRETISYPTWIKFHYSNTIIAITAIMQITVSVMKIHPAQLCDISIPQPPKHS